MRIPLPVTLVATAFAPVFVVFWVVAEAGRAMLATTILATVVGVAIALAPWRPFAAVVVGALLPVLQLVGLMPSFSSTDWPVALGLLVPLAVAGYSVRAPRSIVVLIVALAGVVAFVIGVFELLPLDDRIVDQLVRPTDGVSGGARSDPRLMLAALATWLVGWVVVAAIWSGAAGLAASTRAAGDRAALERAEADLEDAQVEQAVIGERARIARDVHDAMAHSLAIVVAQADGALASGATDDANAALATIAETARRALSDVRDVLERIEGDGPALGADDIPALVDGVRATGLRVRLSVSGVSDAVPTAVSLAAYRIVQEALTNALRHTTAPASADVTIDWRGRGAVVLVASTGAPRDHSGGAGRGIVGMTERARMLGGWLSAGRSGDEFVVTATLPYVEPLPDGLDGVAAVAGAVTSSRGASS